MGKTGKWFKNFLSGKKEKAQKDEKNAANGRGSSNQNNAEERLNPTTQVVVFPRPTTPKEKKRWSFRRSSATAAGPKDTSAAEVNTVAALPDTEQTREKEAVEIVDVTTDVVIPSTDDSTDARTREIEESAAVKIQSVFRSYLARKALKALRGLVKLQALVRGHLVRKQATETLRCMQALVTAQARARAQRIRTVADDVKTMHHRQSTHRRSSQEKIKHSYHDMEENIKIVEMDHGEYGSNDNGLNSYAVPYQQQNGDRMDNRMSTYYSPQQQQAYSKHEYQQISPAPSAMTDLSPRTCSGHFEDYTFATAQSSPQCFTALSRPDPSRTPFSFPNPDFADTMSYEYPLYPSYMANTESSRAKARSQSAPKQRPEFERQLSRGRRPSVEGRGIPKGARMQRSSSHVSSTAQNYQYPWSVKLDKSTVSLKESECGSSCSVFTNANYCRSVVSYDPRY